MSVDPGALIEWVNSINTPSWLHVKTLDDLTDCVALCDIFCFINNCRPMPDLIRISQDRTERSLHNARLLLKALKRLDITDQELVGNQGQIASILYELSHKFGTRSIETQKSAPNLSFKKALISSKYSEKESLRNSIRRMPSSTQITSPYISSTISPKSILSKQISPRSIEVEPNYDLVSPKARTNLLFTETDTVTFQDLQQAYPETEQVGVSAESQNGIIEWIEGLQLIRRKVLSRDNFPSIVRTGVFLCDLINRLEGKSEIILGIQRNPKNTTTALANINKALEHLKGKPKMSAVHLWEPKKILHENKEQIWGLLDDIRNLYKVSPHTPQKGKAKQIKSKRAKDLQTSVSLTNSAIQDIFLNRKEQATPQRGKRQYQPSQSCRNSYHPELNQPKDSVFPLESTSPKDPPFLLETGQQKDSVFRLELTQPKEQLFRISTDSIPVRRIEDSAFYEELFPREDENINELVEVGKQWLISIGLNPNTTKPGLLNDPLRNGVLLCNLVAAVEDTCVYRTDNNPKTIESARNNLLSAFKVLKSRKAPIPVRFIDSPEDILKGDSLAIWGLISAMKVAYPDVPSTYTTQKSKTCLPYSFADIVRLEESLLVWTQNLGIPITRLTEIASGELLCGIVERVCNIRLRGVNQNPRSQASKLSNIKKAMEALRKQRKMSQGFLWKHNEVAAAETDIILGLLEDLNRFADKKPARKAGERYFDDGPYIKFSKTKETINPERINGSTFYPSNTYDNRPQNSIFPPSPAKTTMSRPATTRTRDQSPVMPSTITQWLANLGFQSSINFRSKRIDAFRSGVVFAQIVEKLEGAKIKGVQAYPLTQAARTNNIRNVISFLRFRKRLPAKFIHSDEMIAEGNGVVIRELLGELQKQYRQRSETFTKFKNRLSRKVAAS